MGVVYKINVKNNKKEKEEDFTFSDFTEHILFLENKGKFSLKIGLNKGKTAIFIKAEKISLIQDYFFFTKISENELQNIDKIFKQFDTLKEAVELLNNLADKENNEDSLEASIIDDQMFSLTFNGKIFNKNYSFDIILLKQKINREDTTKNLVKIINKLWERNDFLEKYVRKLRNKVRRMEINNNNNFNLNNNKNMTYNNNMNFNLNNNNNSKIICNNEMNFVENYIGNLNVFEGVKLCNSQMKVNNCNNYPNNMMKMGVGFNDNPIMNVVLGSSGCSMNNNTKKTKFNIIYRMSEKDDTIDALFDCIKNKSNLLFLIKTKENLKFGGFINEAINIKNIKKYSIKDKNAFLFSLYTKKIYTWNSESNLTNFTLKHSSLLFPNGFCLNNHFLTSKHYTMDLETLKTNWNNFTEDYELNDEFEDFEIEEFEVFQAEHNYNIFNKKSTDKTHLT